MFPSGCVTSNWLLWHFQSVSLFVWWVCVCSNLSMASLLQIKDYESISAQGFMQGFDGVVWGVVAIQAFGGLVVAVVIKYADNILKAFATSVSIILSAIATVFIVSAYPTMLFIGGAALVIGAVVLYSVFPYKAPKAVVVEGCIF